MLEENCQRRDPVELLLRGILRSALLYAGVCALAACGDSAQSGGGTDTPKGGGADGSSSGDWKSCEQRVWVEASDLTPSAEYDYVAVRRFNEDSLSTKTGLWTTQSEVGEACATASDKAACTAALQAAPSDCVPVLYSMLGCSELSAVTTRGDSVERWAGSEENLALLGEIDTPAEAELVAILAGYGVCGNRATRAKAGGFEVSGAKVDGCPSKVTGYMVRVDREGKLDELSSKVLSTGGPCAGRLPDGLCSRATDQGADGLGDMLARVAHLEAASVFAFEHLARELSAHGAPAQLIRAARAAHRDEIKHARVVAALARARGGRPVEARVAQLAVRSLEEIARENAVEGCVRETYGALVGAHQALCAEDAALRVAMQTIAEDEARHAALSHQVDAWLMERLDAPARARVRMAKRDAVRELCASALDTEVSELERRAGFPSRPVACSMVGKLARSVWADALAA